MVRILLGCLVLGGRKVYHTCRVYYSMPIHDRTLMPMRAHHGVLMHCIYQGHANQARITTWPRNSTDTLYAKDVVTFAQKNGQSKILCNQESARGH